MWCLSDLVCCVVSLSVRLRRVSVISSVREDLEVSFTACGVLIGTVVAIFGWLVLFDLDLLLVQ